MHAERATRAALRLRRRAPARVTPARGAVGRRAALALTVALFLTLTAAASTDAVQRARKVVALPAGTQLTTTLSTKTPMRLVLELRTGLCPPAVRVVVGGRTAARFRPPRRSASTYSLGPFPPGHQHVTLIAARAARCRGTLGVVRLTARPLPTGSPPRPSTPAPAPTAPGVAPILPPVPVPVPAPAVPPPSPGTTTTATTGQPPAAANPLAALPFYVDPDSSAAATEADWRAAGRDADADQIAKLADNAHAAWFGDWNGPDPRADVSSYVQRAHYAGALPLLVAYDIPSRDCGGFSAGGASSAQAYQSWIDGFAAGLEGPAAVILEPDALAELDCLDPAGQQRALDLLGYATAALGSRSGVSVYLDAGNAGWHPAWVIAQRLLAAGVDRIRGFSLNVSNFDWTASELSDGDQIAQLVGDKHFVIDTGRNGRGPAADGSWCNPPGRGLGAPPTVDSGDPLADAFLWIKVPGESDGTCNGGPTAGTWWADYALELAENSSF